MRSVTRVLVVEDHFPDAVLLEEWLELAEVQWEVVHVVTFAEATSRWPDGRFDALLLDLDIPDGFGLDLVERGLALAGAVPVVVLSGRADEAVAAGAVGLGARAYVVKGPASVHELRAALEGQRD
ncbi:response regulator [Deinococcus deserti]|uniref:Putative response regulator, CheY n=1 Tax=Deinococcus deserti (strain DSM 17065 / CIP 109153 / LMG 22923 / VCD115) TaxID=546414 RepID=C1D495_DEIDV|nr:response regulator [Deinococcus deserti]ACO47976.1 putative response regulator, CheY [Deinococcus deserti VCD115]